MVVSVHAYSCSLNCADVESTAYSGSVKLKSAKFYSETKGTLKWSMSFHFLAGKNSYELKIFLDEPDETERDILIRTSLLNSEGEEVYSLRESFQNFTKTHLLPTIVIKRDLLLELEAIKDGFFAMTIHCDILTSEELDDELSDVYASENRLLEDLSKLYTTKEDSDVTLLFIGTKIRAHRFILMLRSPVFKAMFRHNTTEKMTNVIEIADVNVETGKEMLHFMYTGEPPEFDDPLLAEELLVAAEKYAIEDLKELCEYHLIKITTTESALKYLRLAHINHANRLENFCLHFIRFNKDQLLINDRTCSFCKEFPYLFNKAFQRLTISET